MPDPRSLQVYLMRLREHGWDIQSLVAAFERTGVALNDEIKGGCCMAVLDLLVFLLQPFSPFM